MKFDDVEKLFRNAPPSFVPPYDSPIEEDFAYNVVKYLKENVVFDKQVSVQTPKGNFRLDFKLSFEDCAIGLECDGKEFHDECRDEWRDSLIIGEGLVDDIIRIPGRDIHRRIHICLYQIAEFYPDFFSERGKINIETLAFSEAQSIDEYYKHPHGGIDLTTESGIMRMKRMVRIESRIESSHHLAKIYKFAIENNHTELDEIIKEYNNAFGWNIHF